ncbi:Acetaldehyde dehydrogenase [uncultured spirochete]|jgi:acetaldehyde dehydrogenase (acetylating)|uniref:Acetaldehyde dehydrogenase n=1 Tax=uncultured spirochete TaxID=156406 RepID=A0A3P3XIZ5_9SPIR|nr:aldehyde dehydrogenase family protein [Rectinema subterraneum]SLM12595.1 Acetaldehyde dehydrogenase [uncultured spirochete]HBE45869.1 acetaldehyde dehydrogenase [Spirochaetaceae bacterium]
MTEIFDADLVSIQEARRLANAAKEAQKKWAGASQEEVDRVCAAMAEAGAAAAEKLARLAVEETGFGVVEHKVLKNLLTSRDLWTAIRDVKTVGIIGRDESRGLVRIANPMGVVVALIPSTNPTSTAFFKTMIAVKARDAIVVAPHPSAVRCTFEATRVMAEAAVKAGAPEGLIACMEHVSLQGTDALMRHKATSLILATGGTPMVRAAHSVGKPAYGVGPGNVPCYIDRSADLPQAARLLVASKAFDHSVICATEQAAVVDKPIAGRFAELVQAEGAYFVSESEANALRRYLFKPDGAINPTAVGKSPQVLAKAAGFSVPDSARILIARLSKVGPEEPLSREKLTTVLGWYEVDGWREGCNRSLELIHFGGEGHSIALHARDEAVITAFGLEKPVHRIVVNTMSSLGAVGVTTGIAPSMTLGPGGVGGAITGDNISVQHLFTVKNIVYGLRDAPAPAMTDGTDFEHLHAPRTTVSAEEIEQIAQRVLAELQNRHVQ